MCEKGRLLKMSTAGSPAVTKIFIPLLQPLSSTLLESHQFIGRSILLVTILSICQYWHLVKVKKRREKPPSTMLWVLIVHSLSTRWHYAAFLFESPQTQHSADWPGSLKDSDPLFDAIAWVLHWLNGCWVDEIRKWAFISSVSSQNKMMIQ